jgi:hypothetical protein
MKQQRSRVGKNICVFIHNKVNMVHIFTKFNFLLYTYSLSSNPLFSTPQIKKIVSLKTRVTFKGTVQPDLTWDTINFYQIPLRASRWLKF